MMSLMTLMEMGHPKEHLSRAPLTSIGYSRNSPTEKLIMGRVFFFTPPPFPPALESNLNIDKKVWAKEGEKIYLEEKKNLEKLGKRKELAN